MKFVISGANGFIGSRLVNKLFESGYNVIGIVRNSRENVDSIKGKCKLVFSELEDLNISDFKHCKDALYQKAKELKLYGYTI